MKPRYSNQTNLALTLVEVMVVLVVLAVLACMFLPVLAEKLQKQHSLRINCVNNLKEIGLSYLVWAEDNGGKFPMEISEANGGVLGLSETRNAWINFLAISNELNTPKILVCPADKNRSYATNFVSGFSSANISYFVGLDAKTNFPEAFLSGDDNFAIGGIPVKSGILKIPTNLSVSWTSARHEFAGNIGLADGSVQQVNTNGLQQALQQTGLATNRLAIP